jgi:hypothetical protein
MKPTDAEVAELNRKLEAEEELSERDLEVGAWAVGYEASDFEEPQERLPNPRREFVSLMRVFSMDDPGNLNIRIPLTDLGDWEPKEGDFMMLTLRAIPSELIR